MNTIVLSYDNLNTIYKKYRTDFVPFEGKTKESYLEWRKNWRQTYSRLSDDIRTLKNCRKGGEGRTDIQQRLATDYAKYLRSIANYAIEYRKDSKVTASQNYLNMREVEMA